MDRFNTIVAGLLAIALTPAAASAALLTGSYTAIPSVDGDTSGFVNFADEGTVDWVLWNSTSPTAVPTQEKAGGTAISSATAVGVGTTLNDVGGTDLSFSTVSGATSGSQFSRALAAQPFNSSGQGVGLSITVPTLDTYHARIYVGGFRVTLATITATLSGATPLVATDTFDVGDGGKDAGVLNLTFTPDSLSGGDNVLNVSIVLTTDDPGSDSHVLMQGATLSIIPEPGSLALLGLGGLSIAVGRRR